MRYIHDCFSKTLKKSAKLETLAVQEGGGGLDRPKFNTFFKVFPYALLKIIVDVNDYPFKEEVETKACLR